MILDAILGPLLVAFQTMFSALPSWSLLGAIGVSAGGATAIGSKLGMVNSFLPITEMLTMLVVTYTALLSISTVYKLANWVYRHFPEIMGCGPGGGG